MTHFLTLNLATGYPNNYRNGDYPKSASGSYKMKLFGIGTIKVEPDVAMVILVYASLERAYLELAKTTTPIIPGEIEFKSKIETVFSYYA